MPGTLARAEADGRDDVAAGRDPPHRTVDEHIRLTRVGRRAVLELDVRTRGRGADELLLDHLPVDRVVDVTGEVEVGGAEPPGPPRRAGGRRGRGAPPRPPAPGRPPAALDGPGAPPPRAR